MSIETTARVEAAAPRASLRELFALALPNIGSSVLRLMMGFIDFAMVSVLGTEAQAALSPATLLIWTVSCVAVGSIQSVQTYVSQSRGRGAPRDCGAYAWQSFYVAIVAGLLSWPAAATSPIWMSWIGAQAETDPRVTAAQIDYLRIGLWSILPSVLGMGMEAFFNGIQRPQLPLYALIAALAANAAGNYVLIFGKFGFPELGIAGAAYATVFGWWVRVAVLAVAFLDRGVDQEYVTRRAWRPDGRRLREVLTVGLPTGFQWLIDLGAWVVFLNYLVPPYGKQALAASNVVLQYTHLAFMPAVGVGIALCSQVGHAIGAGNPALAAAQVRLALRVNGLYMLGVGVFMFAAREWLLSLFSGDAEVIAAGAIIMIWAAAFQLFDAVGITYSFALRGAGDTRWPAVAFVIACWGIMVGGGLLITRYARELGPSGPWVMCMLYIIVLGLLLLWRFESGAWRKIRIFLDAPPGPAAPPEPHLASAGGS